MISGVNPLLVVLLIATSYTTKDTYIVKTQDTRDKSALQESNQHTFAMLCSRVPLRQCRNGFWSQHFLMIIIDTTTARVPKPYFHV